MAFSSLHDRLRGPITDSLKKRLGVKNALAVPRIEKVVVNVGINIAKMDSKEMREYIAESLKQITGQKPVFRLARKAVSNFKIREGSVVGAVVTLRGKHMEAFLDKLVHIALPRVRDFRGVPAALDGHGNYSIGLREHTVFPEVTPPSDASRLFGMQISIATKSTGDDASRMLFEEIGIPFRKEAERGSGKKSKDQE